MAKQYAVTPKHNIESFTVLDDGNPAAFTHIVALLAYFTFGFSYKFTFGYDMRIAVPAVPGPQPSQPAANALVSQIEWLNPAGEVMASLTGLSITYQALRAGASLTDLQARYAFWVSLLDGDVTITGSTRFDLFLELGAGGTATVNGGADTDKLYVWHQKNIVYDGGAGTDIIAFLATNGVPYPTAFTQQLIVNLTTGVGQNPYGGTLLLTSVENIIGTSQADDITGSDAANIIGDPFDTGADIVNAMGGDDVVKLGWNSAAGGATVDGGAGFDELQFLVSDDSTNSNIVRLDIENKALNTFVFAGGTYTNIERFVAGSFGGGGDTDIFAFGGSAANEIVTGTSVQAFVGPAFRPLVGRDQLSGRGGNDTLSGLGGTDTLDGGAGDDMLRGGADVDTLDGGAGFDTADFSEKTVAVVAFLNGATQIAVTIGGVNEDIIRNVENLMGGSANDSLIGDGLANVFNGNDGQDFLFSNGFNPDGTMKAAAGNDTLNGGAGNDGLFAGDGNDTLSGGDGADGMVGGGGTDTLNGGIGGDFLFGGGFTTGGAFAPNSGNDTLNGGDGNDGLWGQDGNDTINGDAGDDYVEGGDGIDTINGGAGGDTILGQGGNDVINGGAGFDYLYGGLGGDTFALNVDDSYDTVWDFVKAEGDKLRLDADLGVTTFAQFQARITGFVFEGANYTVLNFASLGHNDQVTIKGVATGDWTAGMVTFV